MENNKQTKPEQEQTLPGSQKQMHPKPVIDNKDHKGTEKLKNKVALITGGDSGIGSAVAILFAKEGANIAVVYLNEHEDAEETKKIVESYGVKILLLPGDISKEDFCNEVVEKTITEFGTIDILVNNAAVQFESEGLENITTKNLLYTYQVNIFAMFFITRAALKYLKEGSCIINTTSVTAYKGSPQLIDYSSTKGAIVSFTRSLAANLAKRGIRVNGVAPGPIWTPLIPASFDEKKTSEHGSKTPLGRAGEPVEVAPSYLFLATDASSYMTGQILHPNGGEIVNG